MTVSLLFALVPVLLTAEATPPPLVRDVPTATSITPAPPSAASEVPRAAQLTAHRAELPHSGVLFAFELFLAEATMVVALPSLYLIEMGAMQLLRGGGDTPTPLELAIGPYVLEPLNILAYPLLVTLTMRWLHNAFDPDHPMLTSDLATSFVTGVLIYGLGTIQAYVNGARLGYSSDDVAHWKQSWSLNEKDPTDGTRLLVALAMPLVQVLITHLVTGDREWRHQGETSGKPAAVSLTMLGAPQLLPPARPGAGYGFAQPVLAGTF